MDKNKKAPCVNPQGAFFKVIMKLKAALIKGLP